ncbi:hypothetical protein PanWU01x14_145580 [Parasponia andersonii]|uniref:Uncharacterized protein n=1 Tax=Parasponia andersonii TaxID=3476 RepID=A0A2P5CK58_PARAD|nr:hypothetical protein PanWU01x14_145580 [Parasponia andersonii]
MLVVTTCLIRLKQLILNRLMQHQALIYDQMSVPMWTLMAIWTL